MSKIRTKLNYENIYSIIIIVMKNFKMSENNIISKKYDEIILS